MINDLKNYYEVLEIPSIAKSEDIYQSYQRAKSAYSSDSLALYSLMSNDECRNILELIEEAYSILSDPAKRKLYDEARNINRELNAFNYNALADRIAPTKGKDIYVDHTSATKCVTASNKSFQTAAEFTINSHSSSSSTIGESAVTTNAGIHNSSNITKLVTQKRFALDYPINTDFEKELEDTTEFTGAFLRKIREYKSVDLERLSDMTKVSKLYLQGIENEDFGKLPAPVYVRGFVFQYAKCLKLKPEVVANSYVARMKKLKP